MNALGSWGEEHMLFNPYLTDGVKCLQAVRRRKTAAEFSRDVCGSGMAGEKCFI